MRKSNKKNKFSQIVKHFTLIIICFIMLYPVIWWIAASFKPSAELNSTSFFTKNPTLENFIKGWNALPSYSFTVFFLNSFILNITTTILTAISSSLVAFGFAKINFPLKRIWFSIMMVSIMLPMQVTLIPRYSMFYRFGWVNTYLPFIVVSAAGVPFFIFLMVQFMRGIPRELDESAKIDGCNWWGIYWRIIIPLAKPAIITTCLFSFLWGWEDYLLPLVYINDVRKYTIPLALSVFINTDSGGELSQLLAIALLSVMPIIIIFFSAQRYFVEGIATTGLKG